MSETVAMARASNDLGDAQQRIFELIYDESVPVETRIEFAKSERDSAALVLVDLKSWLHDNGVPQTAE